MLEVPSINGVKGGFESIRFRIGVFDMSQMFRELNYNDEVTPGEIVGAHPIPVDTTLGGYKAAGDFVITDQVFYDYLNTQPDGYTRVVFPVTIVKAVNPQAPGGFNQDVLHDCRILKADNSYKRDDKDGLLSKLTLYVRYITRNGKCLVPLRLG